MKNILFAVFLLGALTACTPTQQTMTDAQSTAVVVAWTQVNLTLEAIPSDTPTVKPTAILIEFTPSPLPTQPPIPFITPDPIQVERWKEYQTELAKSLISSIPPENVFCEWEVLGRSDQDLYIWAVCGKIGGGRWASHPVVIHLESDGSIQNVSLVSGIGSEYINNIHQMFPLDVQEKILNDQTSSMIYQRLSEHLNWRQTHPEEPPLIVLSAIPTATPTP